MTCRREWSRTLHRFQRAKRSNLGSSRTDTIIGFCSGSVKILPWLLLPEVTQKRNSLSRNLCLKLLDISWRCVTNTFGFTPFHKGETWSQSDDLTGILNMERDFGKKANELSRVTKALWQDKRRRHLEANNVYQILFKIQVCCAAIPARVTASTSRVTLVQCPIILHCRFFICTIGDKIKVWDKKKLSFFLTISHILYCDFQYSSGTRLDPKLLVRHTFVFVE